MFSTSQANSPAQPRTPIVVDTTAHWLSEMDDMAFGCECADPSLQIDRWHQEAIQAAPSP